MSVSADLKKKMMQYVLGTAVLVVGAPIYFGAKHTLAEQAGTACEAKTNCRGGNIFSSGMCLSGDQAGAYCSHECSAPTDCPSGLTCEAVEGTWTTETTRGNHASTYSTRKGTKNLCVKPSSHSAAR